MKTEEGGEKEYEKKEVERTEGEGLEIVVEEEEEKRQK